MIHIKLSKKLSVLGLSICLCLLFFNCNNANKNKEKQELSSTLSGEELSKIHCARCHAFPEPKVMPKRYWKEVLPIMGFHLGKKPKGKMLGDYNNKVAKSRLEASGLFPKDPLISDEEWEAINLFYNENAPENLPKQTNSTLKNELLLFEKEVLPWKISGEGLTYLNFEDEGYTVGFNSEKEAFYIKLDEKGHVLQNHQLNYPLVDVIKNGKVELLLSMGRMFNVDEPTGSVLVLSDKPRRFIPNLQRPVDFLVEDFDNDGNMDILVAEFGKYLGGINIYTRKNTIEKTNIHPKSGAVKFVLRDVNNDGLKDFYALVAQEDESIYLFVNKGNLKFEKQQLLSLPSYYGTTHFELLDFDNDGDEDIVCSSGDSDDFASALKPYHGVRLFENIGEHKFEQVWFHKQEGAYGTACADYDNDGDIDIASIGYYASLQNKDEEAFLYFENVSSDEEKWKFKTYTLPKTHNNCFMLIKARDIDNDGDMDILLGSNSSIFSNKRKASIANQWQQNGGVVTILKNTSK